MNEVSSQAVIQTYRRYAPFYDIIFGAALGPGRKQMARMVSTISPASILELGVGTGLTLRHYPSNTHITGIDLSSEMLDRARAQANQLPRHRISLHKMDAERLEFDDNSFACITVPYVLSVTPNPEKLVSELRRVCEPDGHIIIVNHFSGSRSWWLFERMAKPFADRIGFRPEFDYERHILSHDWRVEDVSLVNIFGLSRLVHIRNA